MNESRFDRGAWLALAVVTGWFVLTLGLALWAAQYPQDGWAVNGPLAPDGHFEVEADLAGVPSPLQKGDQVAAINGQLLVNGQIPPLPPNPQVGQVVQYTLRRGEQTLTVEVQLVQPGTGAVVRHLVERVQETPRDLVVALVSFVVAAFAFFLRPGNLGARYLFLFYGFYLAVQLFGFSTSGLYAYTFSPAGLFLYSFIPSSWGWYFFPTLILLTLSFPVVKAPLRRFPHALPALLYGVPLTVSVAAAYLVVTTRELHWQDAQAPIFTVLALLAVVSIFGTMIHNWFTVRDPVTRAQLRWVTLGMGLGLGLPFLVFTVEILIYGHAGQESNQLLWLLMVLPICLAVAITRYRLFDIDIIIRRTVTYAIVTALLLVVFFGSVIVLQSVFARIFPELAESEIITVLSTLAIAALFVPLRNRVQDVIDKRFNRKRFNAQQVMQKFGETVRDETDLEKLTNELVNVVNETMQPKSVSLWLKGEERST